MGNSHCGGDSQQGRRPHSAPVCGRRHRLGSPADSCPLARAPRRPGRRASRDLGKLEKTAGKIAISGRYHRWPKDLSDDYEVQGRVLGSGFNGPVRLALSNEKPGGEKFALKTFKLADVPPDNRAQMEAELEIFLCMDHPHVTRLFDVYEGEDFLYLIMECMEGGELFDRVIELTTFSDDRAAEAVNQMLLALNYIHDHGIVHRDLKLENWLYDKKGSNHLKLIDFGFSKMWDPNVKMNVSCGTPAYVAPEVLQQSYTSQCDLWSLGVIAFMLLAGYMPFSDSRDIAAGKFAIKPGWSKVSDNGRDFIQALLQVDPEKRLTASDALEHTWIKNRERQGCEVDDGVVAALRAFGQSTGFRRCCMEMIAWSLSNEERSQVRQAFLAMDENQQGTISLRELKKALQDKFHVPGEEVRSIFEALKQNGDEEIHYSDFLAAMVGCRIDMHDDHLKSAFKRFDTNNSGYITSDSLREVLGSDPRWGEGTDEMLAEVDLSKDGRISYPEFASYLTGEPLETYAHAAASMLDRQAHNRRATRRRITTGCWRGPG